MRQWKTRVGLAAISCAFIATALLFLPRLGIEADEAMLANGIYDHGAPWYSWTFAGSELPVMIISYLGALKTWLYNPYFLLWAPGPVTLRLPTVLAGAATLWLFFALLDRVAGRRAAWIGTLLLASDSMFLLIDATDFGFVALQFVLKLSAILLLLRFHRGGSRRALAGGFFLLGLALWDKAVFGWVLIGLAAATLAVFPRELGRHLTIRNLGVAAASMLLGALPLAIYNIARPLETLRANVKVAREPVFAKADILFRTVDGSALFGFMTAAEAGPHPGQPRHALQTWSLWAARFPAGAARPPRSLMLYALAAATLAVLVFWRAGWARPAWFGLAACAATWLPMALTPGAGGAVQHTILLWPFHLLVIAAVVAQLPLRWSAAIAAVLCLSNLAVTNRYYAGLIRNGPGVRWTDAIGPLEQYLLNSKADRIFIADWGFIETLCLLTEGDLPVYSADVPDPAMLRRMIGGPRQLFVSHTPELAFLPEIRARVEEQARQDGYEEEHLATIFDRNGRPTFDVFRFRKVHL